MLEKPKEGGIKNAITINKNVGNYHGQTCICP